MKVIRYRFLMLVLHTGLLSGLSACVDTAEETGVVSAKRTGRPVEQSEPAGTATMKSLPELNFHLEQAQASHALGEPVLLSVTLHNNSARNMRILPWGTPLEAGFKANMFTVKALDSDHELAYTGRMMKRGRPTAEDYQAIAAGSALSARIDLGQGYAITQPGCYSVELKPKYISVQGADLKRAQSNSIVFEVTR